MATEREQQVLELLQDAVAKAWQTAKGDDDSEALAEALEAASAIVHGLSIALYGAPEITKEQGSCSSDDVPVIRGEPDLRPLQELANSARSWLNLHARSFAPIPKNSRRRHAAEGLRDFVEEHLARSADRNKDYEATLASMATNIDRQRRREAELVTLATTAIGEEREQLLLDVAKWSAWAEQSERARDRYTARRIEEDRALGALNYDGKDEYRAKHLASALLFRLTTHATRELTSGLQLPSRAILSEENEELYRGRVLEVAAEFQKLVRDGNDKPESFVRYGLIALGMDPQVAKNLFSEPRRARSKR